MYKIIETIQKLIRKILAYAIRMCYVDVVLKFFKLRSARSAGLSGGALWKKI